MWIREIKKEYLNNLWGASDNLKFLWKSDDAPIYIMDNHLAAAWCWMQECKIDEEYNFIHIDQHSDLATYNDTKYISSLKKGIPIEKYLSLLCDKYGVFEPTLKWDNYIHLTNILFPNWLRNSMFATHRDLHIDIHKQETGINICESIAPYLLLSRLKNLFDESEPTKWIVNVDLDYFFCYNSVNKIIPFHSEGYIQEIGSIIGNHLSNIQVLTIALSPSCCGGWGNAFECSRLFLLNPILIESCIEYLEEKKIFPYGWHR